MTSWTNTHATRNEHSFSSEGSFSTSKRWLLGKLSSMCVSDMIHSVRLYITQEFDQVILLAQT